MYASRGAERRQQVIRRESRNMGDERLCERQTANTTTTTTSCHTSPAASSAPAAVAVLSSPSTASSSAASVKITSTTTNRRPLATATPTSPALLPATVTSGSSSRWIMTLSATAAVDAGTCDHALRSTHHPLLTSRTQPLATTTTTLTADPIDTDSRDLTSTSSRDPALVSMDSSSPFPDVAANITDCVTDPHFLSNSANTPVCHKSLPRIRILSSAQVRDLNLDTMDTETSPQDDGIFSADMTPDDSSDEVTVRMISSAGQKGKSATDWKLRSGGKMDVASDDDRDLDDGYEFGSGRTDDEDEEEDEVDESGISGHVSGSQDAGDRQKHRHSHSMLINDDDSVMSCSISSSNFGSCSNIFTQSLETSVLINGKRMDMTSQRYALLSYDQVLRLDDVMDSVMPIHGRGNFPTLEVKLKHLVTVVRSKLQSDGVAVADIRLNGGAASHVLFCMEGKDERSYSDLDLIFAVDLSDNRNFDKVRTAVLDSLLDFLPAGVNKKRMTSCALKEAYVHKMVKVAEASDRWSLISLCNNSGRDIEIKFVDTMKRQFEFSVDSFQIILDSLLLFYECSPAMTMAENIYPTVVGESVYGNFAESLYHLKHRIIATRSPEEIRGGGLLKYCRLQVLGYRPDNLHKIKTMEKYMCSRFFIDFPDVSVQRVKLANYLNTHFYDDHVKYEYLMILQRVVDESTVCLMGHERRQTLCLIEDFALHFYLQDPSNMRHHMNSLSHPVIPPPYHSDRPHAHQPKMRDAHHQNGGRKHAKNQNANDGRHSQSKKNQSYHQQHCNSQPVPCHATHHSLPQQQNSHPEALQPQHAALQGQSQTLVLASGGQLFYAPTFQGNVSYQAPAPYTQSNAQLTPHPHFHHHHHHHCHNHLPHHHHHQPSPQHHQHMGCFTCCGGSGHCASITWMQCA